MSPNPTTKSKSVFADPAALMRIRSLELRALSVVEGYWKGLHGSHRHGFSAEFAEYRAYVPGDDIRYLDWKVLARRDKTFIRKFREETNLRTHLLLDLSRSMEYGSTGYSKLEYARTLAATLAVFLHGQGDEIGAPHLRSSRPRLPPAPPPLRPPPRNPRRPQQTCIGKSGRPQIPCRNHPWAEPHERARLRHL